MIFNFADGKSRSARPLIILEVFELLCRERLIAPLPRVIYANQELYATAKAQINLSPEGVRERYFEAQKKPPPRIYLQYRSAGNDLCS
jgi:hypothetical protein